MHENRTSGDTNALTKTLARGTGINLAGFAARVLLVFVHSVLAARLFGAQAYGVYAIGVAAVSLLSIIGQFGLGRTTTRFVALHYAKDEPRHIVGTLKLVLSLAVPVSIVLGLVLGIGAERMARLFGEPALAPSFHILAFAVPALTLTTLLAAFTQGFQRMQYKVIALDIVSPVVEVVGLILLAWLGARQLGLPISYTLAVVFSAALLIYFAKLDLGRLPEASPSFTSVPRAALLRPVLGFAMPVWAVNILINVRRRASVLMLGVLSTSATVGVFSVLERLVLLGTTFQISANLMLGPMVADLVERRQFKELSRLYKLATRWVLTASLPFFLMLGFFGDETLRLFGSEFAGNASVLWYLIVAMIFNVATGSCGVVLLMSGHPQYSAVNEAIMLVAVVGLNLVLIPQYGLLGAVWAIAVSTVLVNALRLIQVWWHLRIQPYSWSLLKVVVAGLTMSGLLWLWQAYVLEESSRLHMLGLGGVVALLVYVVVLVALGLDHDEQEMARLLKRRLVRSQTVVG